MSNTATPIINGKEAKLKRYQNQTEEAIDRLCETVSRMCSIIEHQHARIGYLYEVIHKLYPDLDIIETMADSPQEEQRLLDLYVNRNETFDTDLDRYEEICKQVENEFKYHAEYEDIREFAMPRMQRERVRNYA